MYHMCNTILTLYSFMIKVSMPHFVLFEGWNSCNSHTFGTSDTTWNTVAVSTSQFIRTGNKNFNLVNAMNTLNNQQI